MNSFQNHWHSAHSRQLSRREMLQQSGVGFGSLALAGLQSAPPPRTGGTLPCRDSSGVVYLSPPLRASRAEGCSSCRWPAPV